MVENTEEFSDDVLILSQNNNISTNDSIDDKFPIKYPNIKERSKLNLKTALHLDLTKMILSDTEINLKKPMNKTINVINKKHKIRRFTQKIPDSTSNLKIKKIKGSGINFNLIKIKKNNKNNNASLNEINKINIKPIDNKNDKLGKEVTIKGPQYEFTKKINIKNKTCSCVCYIF